MLSVFAARSLCTLGFKGPFFATYLVALPANILLNMYIFGVDASQNNFLLSDLICPYLPFTLRYLLWSFTECKWALGCTYLSTLSHYKVQSKSVFSKLSQKILV